MRTLAKTPETNEAPAVPAKGVLTSNDVVQSAGDRVYPSVDVELPSGAILTTYVSETAA
ncbi:hypothetical protein [Caulobacter phage S2B]|uniref:Uncharacterized protein n=1 Tax=Caulobacter phage S2B TaxID=2759120 RepID=A0AAE7ML88_9CAUD|nr:hypothetical protein [Caulobacter phage S2B]